MKIETFELERIQSLYENHVDYNLTETGLHPYTLDELLETGELEQLSSLSLGYGQTDGDDQLRKTISGLYPGADPSNVLVTSGSAEANFIFTWSHLEPGDRLVLMLPNYMQIWGLARGFGIEVVPFNLKQELNWSPDLDEVKRLITPGTKAVAVCNPNNPTGSVMSQRDMDAILGMAADVGAWVYSDEIYRGAELDGSETASFYGCTGYDRVVVSGGLSKAYGLPGLRIGWLVGPQDVISGGWHHHDYTSISTGILSQWLANQVLQPERRRKVLGRSRKMLNENIDILSRWVDSHNGLFSFIPPEASGMAFIKYSMTINSRELATRLREEKSVFIVDGDCFGMDGYIRIGFGSEKEYLKAGLARIDEFLEENVLF